MTSHPRAICTGPNHVGPRWLLGLYFYYHRDGKRGSSYCRTCHSLDLKERRQCMGHTNREWLDGHQVAGFLESLTTWKTPRQGNNPARLINGRTALPRDKRRLSYLRTGAQKKVSLRIADELATRYNFDLTDLEDYVATA